MIKNNKELLMSLSKMIDCAQPVDAFVPRLVGVNERASSTDYMSSPKYSNTHFFVYFQ